MIGQSGRGRESRATVGPVLADDCGLLLYPPARSCSARVAINPRCPPFPPQHAQSPSFLRVRHGSVSSFLLERACGSGKASNAFSPPSLSLFPFLVLFLFPRPLALACAFLPGNKSSSCRHWDYASGSRRVLIPGSLSARHGIPIPVPGLVPGLPSSCCITDRLSGE